MSTTNVSQAEISKFGALAATWWDPEGPSKTLHDINPCRAQFIAERCPLAGAAVLDIGCGGGLLTEDLARRGARLTGIDATYEVIDVARTHATDSGLTIEYAVATAEDYALHRAGAFDIVVCMELIEHVPDPNSLIAACSRLTRPGGAFFLSTLNRTPEAYLQAILGAEYLLKLLPIGTHDYLRFLTPAETGALLRANQFTLREIRGMRYNPFTRQTRLTSAPRVNYLVHAEHP
jgi:2-polyprenyl-6-hydroxyphenyl methylase / 3-demethylubiquinone-9 3-methyltransferase